MPLEILTYAPEIFWAHNGWRVHPGIDYGCVVAPVRYRTEACASRNTSWTDRRAVDSVSAPEGLFGCPAAEGDLDSGSFLQKTSSMQYRDITHVLHEKGLRATLPRALVWRVLSESEEHFTLEALWQRIRQEIPSVELSTIYRVVEALAQAGLVVETMLPEGVKVVEARSSFHPHLSCRVCGRLYHVSFDQTEELREALARALPGFQIDDVQLLGRGVCPRCRDAGERPVPC